MLFGLSRSTLFWVMIASAGMFGLALFAAPLFIVRLPADHFARAHRIRVTRTRARAWLLGFGLVAKNLIGLACLFFGALMLVLPGQGVLTILIGLALLDFPGKFRLQRWVVSRRGVLDSLNWIRKRAGREPFTLEP